MFDIKAAIITCAHSQFFTWFHFSPELESMGLLWFQNLLFSSGMVTFWRYAKKKFHFSKDKKVTKKKIIQKPNDDYWYPNTPKYCNMQMKLARDRLVTTGSTVIGSPWPWRQTFKHSSLSIAIIYSWLIQPYGMVSQKLLTFLRFAPASLKSAVQLLSLTAMETVGQYWSSQSKRYSISKIWTHNPPICSPVA